MAQREWVEKDFYKELGVSSDASADEIKRAYRKLASRAAPRHEPGDPAAEERFKAVSEAHSVLSDRPSARNTTRPAGSSPAAASVGPVQRRQLRRVRRR